MPTTLHSPAPSVEEIWEFNRSRWAELCGDTEIGRELSHWEGRVETDAFGEIIMSPPAAGKHGGFQAEIAFLLKTLRPDGVTRVECPISTTDGVRASDVAWFSRDRFSPISEELVYPTAPEVCVEVVSPSNSPAQLARRRDLFVEQGCQEFWLCDADGEISFFLGAHDEPAEASKLVPHFPSVVQIP